MVNALVKLVSLAMLLFASQIKADGDNDAGSLPSVQISIEMIEATKEPINDFSRWIDPASPSNAIGDQKLAKYLSDIRNYDVSVEEASNTFRVYIGPRLSEEQPAIFGGDAEYVVDRTTYKILKKQYGK